MLTYILQVIFFQLLFLLVYEFLLKKETFFTYNRWYLLLTPLLAMIFPLLKIESLGSLVPAEGFMMLPNVYLNSNTGTLVSAETTTQIFAEINWWWIIYAGGILGSLVVFIKKYLTLNKMFRFQVVFSDESVRIIRVPNSNIACTYFNTVFLGDQLSGTEEQQIMSHELVHVKQNHSADLLFFEMLKILLWFNPLVYIYQSRLTVLHEFIADAGALKTSKKQSYYQQLLNTAFNTKNISFINQFFNQSLIKKRIVMLQKSKSKTIAKFKYLILVPLMLVMLTYVSCTQDKSVDTTYQDDKYNEIIKSIDNREDFSEEMKEHYKKMVKNEMTLLEDKILRGDKPLPPPSPDAQINENSDVPFAVIEQVPVFPGCEDSATNDDMKKCMSGKIDEFVRKKFNADLGSQLGLTGVIRVIVQFKIDKNGYVTDVRSRAPHPRLEQEAERVINSLPKMQPGKQRGKPVGVMYSLPIVFQVGE